METEKKGIYITATIPERIMFGCEAVASALMLGLVVYYFQPFCTEFLKMPAWTPGLIMAINMLIDAITDPIFGVIVDKHSISKKRRYSPWYTMGIVVFCLGILGYFWAPPIHDPVVLFIYVFSMYTIGVVGNTFITVAMGPLRNIITTDPAQRSSLPMFSAAMGLTSALLVANVNRIVNYFGRTVEAFRWLATGFAVLSLIGSIFVVIAIRKKDEIAAKRANQNITVKEIWLAIKTNRPLQMLLLADMSNAMAGGMMAAATMYFYKYIVGDIQLKLQPTVATIGIFTNVAGVILASTVAKKYGRKWAYMAGTYIAIFIAVFILIFRPFSSLWLFIPAMSIWSIFGALTESNKWVMISDCVDYGYWKTGKYAPAVYSSAFSLGNKLAIAIAFGILGLILGLVGFVDNNSPDQPQKVIAALMVIMCVIPMLGHLVAVFTMRYYEIDAGFYERMTREIAGRRAAEESQAQTGSGS